MESVGVVVVDVESENNEAGDVAAVGVGVDKLCDIGEWERKGLIGVDENDWFRRGFKGGAGAGMIVGGIFGLFFWVALTLLALWWADEPVLDWKLLTTSGWLMAIAIVYALAGTIGGGVAGAAACRLIKGKSRLYGLFSKIVGVVGGIVGIIIAHYVHYS